MKIYMGLFIFFCLRIYFPLYLKNTLPLESFEVEWLEGRNMQTRFFSFSPFLLVFGII